MSRKWGDQRYICLCMCLCPVFDECGILPSRAEREKCGDLWHECKPLSAGSKKVLFYNTVSVGVLAHPLD